MKKPTYPIGKSVTFKRFNGIPASGRIVSKDEQSNGIWISINTAPKGATKSIVKVRPAQIQA